MAKRRHIVFPVSRGRCNGRPHVRLKELEVAHLETQLRDLREQLAVERLAVEGELHALRAAQEQTAAMQESNDFGLVGLATFSLDGVVLHINDTGAQMLGHPIDALKGRPLQRWLCSAERVEWWRYFRGLRHGGKMKHEWRFRRPDLAQGECMLEFTSVLIGRAGRWGAHVRAAFRDITDQREAERARSEAQAELKIVADSAPVVLARCTRTLRYQFVNHACADWLQRPREKIVGRSLREVMGEKALAEIRPYIKRVLTGEVVSFEQETMHPQSGRRLMHVVYKPELDAQGRVSGWLLAMSDITLRKQAELALRESEERFRQMADAAPVLIWISDADKRSTYFNKAWLDFTGGSLERQLGQGWAESVHPEDRAKCLSGFGEAFDRREEFFLEYRLRRHDGTYRWIYDHGVPRYAGQGFAGYIGSSVDITSRREVEQVLRDARDTLQEQLKERNWQLQTESLIRQQLERVNHRLATIVDSSADAILSCGLDGKVTSWNHTATRLYGYQPGEMMGRPERKLIPPELRKPYSSMLKQIHRGGQCGPFETVRLGKGGRRLDVMLRLSPVKDGNGVVVGVSQMTRDISARKVAEEALRQSELRLQAITDNCPALIFLKDAQGRYRHINRRFAQVHGVTQEDVAGKTDAEIFPASQAAISRASDLRVMEGGVALILDEVSEQEDGQHVSLVTKFPLFDAHKKIYALGGVVTDLTERRRLEDEILQISEREQCRIAQDLHDSLGQQLAGLCCMGDVLRQNLIKAGSPYANSAAKIAKLLHVTVAQTRGLARGLHPVQDEPRGLMAALHGLANSVSELFKVRCRLHCTNPVMINNPTAATHLFRIAQEAVSNAVRHGRAQHIEIKLSASSEEVKLAVRDDGRGFGKPKRRSQGMGLRIMDYRAQMIRGTVRVSPRQTRGTEVVCVLPREMAAK